MNPTTIEVTVEKVIDGDTIHVVLNGNLEKLRLLGIDTEESHDDTDTERKQTQKGGKPITKLGNLAKKRTRELIKPNDLVLLTFPDDSSLNVALEKHRGNYGRLLCFVTLENGQDFQELMIREGYSPYMVKYGFVELMDRHFSYQNAEALAQAEGRGVWNSRLFNFKRMRDYKSLLPWWNLRANIIENYRLNKSSDNKKILNTRKDYRKIKELSDTTEGTNVTIFTELRYISLIDDKRAIIKNGSNKQPFKLFIPNLTNSDGVKIISVLKNRYLTFGYNGSSLDKAGRDYAYISGDIIDYNGTPEIVITKFTQISDAP